MSNQIQTQYKLTQKIIQKLDELAETTGIKVELDFNKYFGLHKITNALVCISDYLAYHLAIDEKFEYLCGAFEERQIKDVLIAYEGKLGSKKTSVKIDKTCYKEFLWMMFGKDFRWQYPDGYKANEGNILCGLPCVFTITNGCFDIRRRY